MVVLRTSVCHLLSVHRWIHIECNTIAFKSQVHIQELLLAIIVTTMASSSEQVAKKEMAEKSKKDKAEKEEAAKKEKAKDDQWSSSGWWRSGWWSSGWWGRSWSWQEHRARPYDDDRYEPGPSWKVWGQ